MNYVIGLVVANLVVATLAVAVAVELGINSIVGAVLVLAVITIGYGLYTLESDYE